MKMSPCAIAATAGRLENNTLILCLCLTEPRLPLA